MDVIHVVSFTIRQAVNVFRLFSTVFFSLSGVLDLGVCSSDSVHSEPVPKSRASSYLITHLPCQKKTAVNGR
jgi:hypothetical protein